MFEFTNPTEGAPQSPRSLAASIVVHGLAIVLLFAIRFSGVARFPAAPEHFTLIAPARETPTVRPPVLPPKTRAQPVREFRPLPPVRAHLELPALPVISAPEIEIPRPVLPEAPVATTRVAMVKPTGFSESRPAAPAPAPKPVVKAAGFESPDAAANGPARGALSASGLFESAHAAEGSPARNAIARSAGFSEVAAASSSGARRSAVVNAAFGDTTVEKSSAPSRQMTASARLTPVEIISKPKPAYTAEGRAKKLEGEVVLEVQFTAAGDARVLRMVRGLGAGLDETAVAAAQGIRFRPATRDGETVDSTAVVHILFQLAN
ncbi:MAG TPA: energy transducer TonB [Bryobacteraceae bacterium]|nr:energy transducer TonB [Bryobacteraceae bacterium]